MPAPSVRLCLCLLFAFCDYVDASAFCSVLFIAIAFHSLGLISSIFDRFVRRLAPSLSLPLSLAQPRKKEKFKCVVFLCSSLPFVAILLFRCGSSQSQLSALCALMITCLRFQLFFIACVFFSFLPKPFGKFVWFLPMPIQHRHFSTGNLSRLVSILCDARSTASASAAHAHSGRLAVGQTNLIITQFAGRPHPDCRTAAAAIDLELAVILRECIDSGEFLSASLLSGGERTMSNSVLYEKNSSNWKRLCAGRLCSHRFVGDPSDGRTKSISRRRTETA